MTTCCPFRCNPLCLRVSALCSNPDLYSLYGGQRLIKKDNPDIKRIVFCYWKLMIIVLFHTTGGSDEGQDWELTKVCDLFM